MDHREQDSKNTRSQQFHPLQFAILSILFVIVITGVVSYFTNPGKPIRIPLITHHLSLKEVTKAPWITLTVKRGDYLSKVFSRNNLNFSDYNAIIQLPLSKKTLESIAPGDKIYVLLNNDKDRAIKKLIYLIDPVHYLEITHNNKGFSEKIVARHLTKKETFASGTIHQSFMLAAFRAGLSGALTSELTQIFGWDVNFAHGTQPNDQFKVLYDVYYSDGEVVKTGDIIAAEFINNHQPYYAIRYTVNGKTDYYRPDGKSIRRAFLRAPIKYKYVSSPFNSNRLHPILHISRPHEGVDLAAPVGTPIHASSDGEITFRGRRGGYGKCIIMQNGPRYSTLFAHMSAFASRFHVGSRVREGQIIGYVGQTGLATGPHLHYEFRINGVHYDPMKVKLPSAQPVPWKERKAYLVYAKGMVARLDSEKA